MSNSLVSIIIPTFNRAHLIGETLDSVLAQTYDNWECIVVDDASVDETANLLKEYVDKDKRFSFYQKPNNLPRGPSASRNFGFRLANGNFINFLDSDDVMMPDKLKKDIEKMNSGSYDFTISQNIYFSSDGSCKEKFWNEKLFSEDPVNDFIVKDIGWSVNAPLWRKESLENKNLVFDEYLLSGDDFLFHLEALQKGLLPVVYSQTTVKIRQHKKRLSEAPIKAPYKLHLFFILLSQNRFQLSTQSICFLQQQVHKQLKNTFGAKKHTTGLKYLFKYTFLDRHPRYFTQLFLAMLEKTEKSVRD